MSPNRQALSNLEQFDSLGDAYQTETPMRANPNDKTDEKIQMLENMIADVRSVQASRVRNPVDEDRLRNDASAIKETIEEVKYQYPIQTASDERVQEAVEQYERLADKRLRQLDKSAVQYRPEQWEHVNQNVKQQMEEDERKLIIEVQDVVKKLRSDQAKNK